MPKKYSIANEAFNLPLHSIIEIVLNARYKSLSFSFNNGFNFVVLLEIMTVEDKVLIQLGKHICCYAVRKSLSLSSFIYSFESGQSI